MMISKPGLGGGVKMERTKIRRMLGLVKSRLVLVRQDHQVDAWWSQLISQRPTTTQELLLELSEKLESQRTSLNMLEMSL